MNAEYIPRFVYDLRIYVEASHPFQIWLTDAVEGCLLESWALETTEVSDNALWLHFYSFEEMLPFAGYGPLFTVDFGEVIAEERPALTSLIVDNSIYADSVYFVVEQEP